MSGAATPVHGQTAVPDSSSAAADSAITPAPTPAPVHPVTVQDSLGIPGTLKGETLDNPERTKAILQRMGANQAPGRTTWEREKNPKVAMLCHTLLPGLGQVYNGRRLKVALMAGAATYYYGTAYIQYKKWHAAEALRDQYPPGSEQYNFQDRLASYYEENARTYLWWSGAVYLLGLLDSWIDAHLYDVRTYTPPALPETETPHAANERTNYLTLGFTLSRAK